MSLSGQRVLVSAISMHEAGPEVTRVARRAVLLGETGGGRVLSPSPVIHWPEVVGLRHIQLQAPPGAAPDALAREVADRVGPALDRIRPQLVHVMGITAAVPVVMRRRAGLKVVVEPGITPSMALRAKDPDLPAARLADLATLEDKVLARADAVVARSTVEASALVRRGVASSKVITVRDPAPTLESPGPLPALPQCLYVEGLQPWSGWQELLHGMARVKVPWRLTLVVPDDGRAQPVRSLIQSLGLESQVTLARLDELPHRLRTSRLVICPLRPEHAVLAGAVTPWGAHWSLASGRPLVAADLPAIRAYTGPAARYFEAAHPGALAEAVTEMLTRPEEVEALAEKGAHIQAGANDAEQILADLWRRLQASDP
ncbi:MAG: glycosyltransferase [Bradymonadia bacterium]